MAKFLEARVARHTAGVSGSAPVRRAELRTDRDTSAMRQQGDGHPHRMHGSHDGGLRVSEHQRKGSKR